jgi:hypothetical protein
MNPEKLVGSLMYREKSADSSDNQLKIEKFFDDENPFKTFEESSRD